MWECVVFRDQLASGIVVGEMSAHFSFLLHAHVYWRPLFLPLFNLKGVNNNGVSTM